MGGNGRFEAPRNVLFLFTLVSVMSAHRPMGVGRPCSRAGRQALRSRLRPMIAWNAFRRKGWNGGHEKKVISRVMMESQSKEGKSGWWNGGDMPEENREEWLEVLRERFEAGDLDGDGNLDVKELRNVLECTDQFCLSRHWLPLEQVSAVMDQYDADKSGKLDFGEFVRMADDHQLLMGVLDDYLQIFQALDSDGSGRIEKTEMRAVMEEMVGKSEEMEESLEKIFQKAAMDGDDSSICFSEFLELIRSHTVDLQMVLDYMKIKPRDGKYIKPSDGMADALSGEEEEAPVVPPGEVGIVHSYGQLEALLKSSPLVVLELTFKWCRPCKMFEKKYRTIAQQFPSVKFVKVIGDENEVTKAMLKKLGIRLSPTFILYKNRNKTKVISGANEMKLRSMVLAALTPDKLPSSDTNVKM